MPTQTVQTGAAPIGAALAAWYPVMMSVGRKRIELARAVRYGPTAESADAASALGVLDGSPPVAGTERLPQTRRAVRLAERMTTAQVRLAASVSALSDGRVDPAAVLSLPPSAFLQVLAGYTGTNGNRPALEMLRSVLSPAAIKSAGWAEAHRDAGRKVVSGVQ